MCTASGWVGAELQVALTRQPMTIQTKEGLLCYHTALLQIMFDSSYFKNARDSDFDLI